MPVRSLGANVSCTVLNRTPRTRYQVARIETGSVDNSSAVVVPAVGSRVSAVVVWMGSSRAGDRCGSGRSIVRNVVLNSCTYIFA